MSTREWASMWHHWPWSTPENATDAAVIHYDEQGGLKNDTHARTFATDYLVSCLGCTPDHAAEILADALARRAANKLKEGQSNGTT